MFRGKKYTDSTKLYDKKQQYEVAEAMDLAVKSATAKFDETIEAHIRYLEETLRGAKIITSAIDTTVVSVGCIVAVHDIEFDEEVEYKIVGSAEANYAESKISNESALGAALIGAKVGDVVDVKAPAGVCQYKVLNIRK